MQIYSVVVGQLDVNCYVVTGSSGECVVIDPGDEAERIAELIDAKKLSPRYILFTHAHYDHVCAARELRDRYKAGIVMHEDELETYRMTKKLCMSWGYEPEDFPPPDRTVRDGDRVSISGIDFEIMHTPGHSAGGISIYGGSTLFTGDTLFRGSVGRTDLPGGNTEVLMASLKKITALPEETRVLCGHGEETTVGRETRTNPFLTGRFRML